MADTALHIITRLDMRGSAQNTMQTCVGLSGKKYRIVLVCGDSRESHMVENEKRTVTVNLYKAVKQGVTVLVSTHDLNLALERFDRLALLNKRLVAYGDPRVIITPESLAGTYGGQAVWRGDDYAMVLGDIDCCGGEGHHHHE